MPPKKAAAKKAPAKGNQLSLTISTAAPKKAAEPKAAPVEPVAEPVRVVEAPAEVVAPVAVVQEEVKVESPAKEEPKGQIIDLAPKAVEVPAVSMENLTDEEKLKLRAARFGQGAVSSTDALTKITEDKKKLEERAQRFGIVTEEAQAKKMQERAERFGIQTKEMQEAKKLERMKRFGLPLKEKNENGEKAPAKEVDPELAAKLASRMERFGAVEESDKKHHGRKRDKKANNKKQQNDKPHKNPKKPKQHKRARF